MNINNIEYWTDRLEEDGVDKYKVMLADMKGNPALAAAQQALEKYDKGLQDKKDLIRDEREIKILKLAEEANEIAKQSNVIANNSDKKARQAITFAGLSILASIAIAVFEVMSKA